MLLIIVSILVIMPAMELWRGLNIAILCALGFKLLSAVPGLIKHRKVFFIHTLVSKVFVVAIFFTAILYFIVGGHVIVNVLFVILIITAFFTVIEEMVIICLIDYPQKNAKGFWEIKKINEEYRSRKKDDATD